MNVNLLIDAVVRQTTILIAQIATDAGGRPSLAHTANQVFVSLVKELKEQGVGNKVIADMFGLALRTYHSKIKRLEESSTYGGRSLWEAILEHIQTRGTVLQTDVLIRFRADEALVVRSVLNDLVDSGLVFRTGRGARVTLRAATPDEVSLPGPEDGVNGLSNFAWVAVNRLGPATVEQLLELVPMERKALEDALEALVADGRAVSTQRLGQTVYSCDGCFIREGEPHGWEAAVFDHYQAVVAALCTKLRVGVGNDHIGGSTYTFYIWSGHPMRDEVLQFLGRVRNEARTLRQRVADYNQTQHVAQDEMTRVTAYVGQTVMEPGIADQPAENHSQSTTEEEC